MTPTAVQDSRTPAAEAPVQWTLDGAVAVVTMTKPPHNLLDDAMLEALVAAYRAERRKIEEAARRNRSKVERGLADVRGKIDRLVRALAGAAAGAACRCAPCPWAKPGRGRAPCALPGF